MAIDPAILRARASQVCHCKHERRFHNSCSLCRCPYFLEQGADKAKIRDWKAEHRKRTLREGAVTDGR